MKRCVYVCSNKGAFGVGNLYAVGKLLPLCFQLDELHKRELGFIKKLRELFKIDIKKKKMIGKGMCVCVEFFIKLPCMTYNMRIMRSFVILRWESYAEGECVYV